MFRAMLYGRIDGSDEGDGARGDDRRVGGHQAHRDRCVALAIRRLEVGIVEQLHPAALVEADSSGRDGIVWRRSLNLEDERQTLRKKLSCHFLEDLFAETLSADEGAHREMFPVNHSVQRPPAYHAYHTASANDFRGGTVCLFPTRILNF